MADTEWLSLADAAVSAGVEPKTLLRAMSNGELAYRARRYGIRWLFIETSVFFRRSDLHVWTTAGSTAVKGHS
jgi:hypothetical protein